MSAHATAWECFGSVNPTDPKKATIRDLPNATGQYVWPEPEITNGVAHIEVAAYGDDPQGAFVRVVGPDKQAVTQAYDRAVELVRGGALRALFGAPT